MIILYDAVVDEKKILILVVVRMRIEFGYSSVGSSTRVSDPHIEVRVFSDLFADLVRKARDFPYCPEELVLSFVVADQKPCRVVSAVFESFKALDQYFLGVLPLSFITEDSAHVFVFLNNKFFLRRAYACGALRRLTFAIAAKVSKRSSSLRDSLARSDCFLRMYPAQTIRKNQNR